MHNALSNGVKGVVFYSKDQQDDLLYDEQKASDAINRWKSHIMRSVNQETAKQNIITNLDENSSLIILDWAMKFLQIRFREKQSDWYGKRGLSWHIASVISQSSSGSIQVTSYAHLFDLCTQDWYAVCSIIEDLIRHLKEQNPHLKTVYLRSDEAGCYHNNLLIASLKDISKMTGVNIQGYYYSEPQAGNDVCDRILCPMKNAIRTYSNEGHDILTAANMRDALINHPVKGTTAAVCSVDELQKSITVKNIQDFSTFHSFSYEDNGIRVWKSYGIGPGKKISYDDIYIDHQGPTKLNTIDSKGFYGHFTKRELKPQRREGKTTIDETQPFECSIYGCEDSFQTFAELQLHLDVGRHSIKRMNQYDQLKMSWALKFTSVDTVNTVSSSTTQQSESQEKSISCLTSLPRGWALSKPRSNVRFSQKVKDYLTAKFALGERTGRKSDPAQVSLDMRSAKDESNVRVFNRTDWLTKTQIQSFFSRLAAARRKGQVVTEAIISQEEDVQSIVEYCERQELVDIINDQVKVSHPIYYDTFDLCERFHNKTLKSFDIAMLKAICRHFEITFKSRDKKQVLIDKISEMVRECTCS